MILSISYWNQAAKEVLVDANQASRTAEIMARYRAAELRFSEDQRVCSDPYAMYFVSEKVKDSLKSPFKLMLIRLWLSWMFPGVHNAVVSRVRYMDDCLIKCLGKGLEQLVIIGAGYDTRAYRIEGLSEKVNVFELDHPATQSAKKETLKEIFDSFPGHITHIPIHLDKDTGFHVFSKS
jgi:methyltransferase (TIGR00027 family)